MNELSFAHIKKNIKQIQFVLTFILKCLSFLFRSAKQKQIKQKGRNYIAKSNQLTEIENNNNQQQQQLSLSVYFTFDYLHFLL